MKNLCATRLGFTVFTVGFLGVHAFGQNAVVTMKLDDPQVDVGGSTTLHVYAQVAPAQRAQADRIFSWFVDLLNPNSSIAQFTGVTVTPASDRDPETSSVGFVDGPNRRGIYDTFLNAPGAGVSAAVELFSVGIMGLSQGTVSFQIVAGSGVPGLTQDFIIAPSGGGTPWLGGDYSQAHIGLTVGASGCHPSLAVSLGNRTGGANPVLITFAVCPGKIHIVEATEDLAHPDWQPLAGAPHNSGSVTELLTSKTRFYRVRVE